MHYHIEILDLVKIPPNIDFSDNLYERSKEVSSFTSKYDDYLKGKPTLTVQEKRGLGLFMSDRAKCANCHVPPLFTNFTYDKPRNTEESHESLLL